jgi:hypothetical protein
VRFKYQKGISFHLEDEWTRSIREDPMSITIIRFEEGAQALTPQLPQYSQDQRMLVIIMKGTYPTKLEVVM